MDTMWDKIMALQTGQSVALPSSTDRRERLATVTLMPDGFYRISKSETRAGCEPYTATALRKTPRAAYNVAWGWLVSA